MEDGDRKIGKKNGRAEPVDYMCAGVPVQRNSLDSRKIDTYMSDLGESQNLAAAAAEEDQQVSRMNVVVDRCEAQSEAPYRYWLVGF